MAKGQLRGNREAKKPKQVKKAVVPAMARTVTQVRAAASAPAKKA